MTAPISNGPTTTRLHHYAGHYCLSETPVAFVRWYLCRIETFIACAGEKWAFVVQFLGAEVSSVSVVPC